MTAAPHDDFFQRPDSAADESWGVHHSALEEMARAGTVKGMTIFQNGRET